MSKTRQGVSKLFILKNILKAIKSAIFLSLNSQFLNFTAYCRKNTVKYCFLHTAYSLKYIHLVCRQMGTLVVSKPTIINLYFSQGKIFFITCIQFNLFKAVLESIRFITEKENKLPLNATFECFLDSIVGKAE